jgi:hypothetical protein
MITFSQIKCPLIFFSPALHDPKIYLDKIGYTNLDGYTISKEKKKGESP